MKREEEFMMQAVELSQKAMDNNEGGPFGCIVVKGDKVVGRGYNKVTTTNDPTAHAEVVAIRDACNNLKTFQLTDCEIYTSCEPCPMCLGAIYWARPIKIYYANSRIDAANVGFDDSMIYEEIKADPNDRKISMIHLQNKKAGLIFEEWKIKADKTAY
ncbi:MAG: nucleoside deaminase [Ginsengibacter sp.]